MTKVKKLKLLIVILVILALVSIVFLFNKKKSTGKTPKQITDNYSNLKLGLNDIMTTYDKEGTEKALAVARSQKLNIKGSKIFVHIYTKGDSITYKNNFEEMGITPNFSKLTNIARAYVTFDQLVKLNGADFVSYVNLPPKAFLDE